MKFNKKGSELSMNVIIIAAIALLVLVVLAVMLLNRTGEVKEGTNCESLGGKCVSDGVNCGQGEADGYPIHNAVKDDSCDRGKKCCLRVGQGDDDSQYS